MFHIGDRLASLPLISRGLPASCHQFVTIWFMVLHHLLTEGKGADRPLEEKGLYMVCEWLWCVPYMCKCVWVMSDGAGVGARMVFSVRTGV